MRDAAVDLADEPRLVRAREALRRDRRGRGSGRPPRERRAADASRAFVKEDDGEPARDLVADRSPLRPMTRAGLRALRARADAERDPSRRAELDGLLAAVREADAPADPRRIGLGATVVVREPGGRVRRYVVGGEDEIDVEHGVIGATSPLGAALAGARAGDRVVWPRPVDDVTLVVESIDYEDER